MKKVMAVFGTRPEAIKMCPVVLELKSRMNLQTVVCVTGQHREMLDQILHVFNVKPDYDLSIMKPNQTLYNITSDVLMGMDYVLEKEKPDVVLVHGDTTTSFAAALACFYRQIYVGHVEAGLRSYKIYSPYPEEFNRQAVDIIANYYFAPTLMARDNLLSEGKPKEKIFVTGNTAIDALKVTIRPEYHHPMLDWASDSKLILLTAHRRENLGEPMRSMFRGIKRVVQEHPDCKVIYPIHKNPVVRSVANEVFGGMDQIRMIEPLDVIDFHNFMSKAYFIMTDSGGIQEEGPSLGKPVLVVRETTERPEGVEAGTLKLVGTSTENIFREVSRLLVDEEAYGQMSRAENPYGDGHASERIVGAILRYFQNKETQRIPA